MAEVRRSPFSQGSPFRWSWDHLVWHSALGSPRVKTYFEYLLRWRFNNHSELPISLFDHYHSKKLSCSDGISHVIICSSCPVAGYYWEEPLIFILTHQLFVHTDKVLQSLLFSTQKTVCFLNLSSHERCSSPLIPLMVLSWTHSSKSMPFVCRGAQT